ncbi:MAG TPA: protein-L-isoaspartate O-methyltransferase, partial [Steroidobacteraceae bacterium]
MTSTQAAREQMIAQQVRTWAVLDTRTLAAMRQVPRERFVPAAWRSLAYADCALPLPLGKHMLTPMLAGRILQALDVKPGDQVLEVGTGSGYLSACLAVLGGNVQTLELHGALATAARSNLSAAGFDGIEVTTADGASLVSETAYDVIVLTASLPLY